jgi:acyl-CoA-binding protein
MSDRLVLHNTKREVVLLTVAVAVLTALVTAWWRRPTKLETRTQELSLSTKILSPRSQLVSATVWKEFEQAANRIRTEKRLRLTSGDKLLLYGLYKHITAGDAPETMPPATSWNVVAEQAKYAAWCKMFGMPIATAIDNYVTAVTHFVQEISPATSLDATVESDEEYDADTTDTDGMFGPAVVSRPAVENGGICEDDDDDTSCSAEVKLLRAAGRNDVNALKALLVSNTTSTTVVNVNYADESGQTALHLAADKGCVECVAVLLAAGADMNASDHDGISVLQAAVIAGHVETCRVLLQAGADAEQADHDGDTPRSCAADDDGDQAMKLLFSVSLPFLK